MQSFVGVSCRRAAVVVALVVALFGSGAVWFAPAPAEAGMTFIHITPYPEFDNKWNSSDVRVVIDLEVAGRHNGQEEQLVRAYCRVNGVTVEEIPELDDDRGYITDRQIGATATAEGHSVIYCYAEFRNRTYSCPLWWCTNDPWVYTEDFYFRSVHIDRTPPTPIITLTPEPNAAGWNNTPVEASVRGNDGAGAGVHSCDGSGTVPETQIVVAVCRDHLYNSSRVDLWVNIDVVAPTLDPVVPEGLVVGDEAVADPGAFERWGSGIATASCDPVDTSMAGTFTLTCTATDVADNTATATVTYDVAPRQHPLDVTVSGDGHVTGTGGIDCAGTCTTTIDEGTGVELVATPTAGSMFTGWDGDCTGTGSCSLVMDEARAVTATFVPDGDGDGIADTPPPTHKDDCKDGGWATFNNPSFSNQGRCVSWVQTGR